MLTFRVGEPQMAEAMGGAVAADAVTDFGDAVADDVVAPRANESGQDRLGFGPLFHNRWGLQTNQCRRLATIYAIGP